MPEGVQAQPEGQDNQGYEPAGEAQEYVQDLMEKASSAAGMDMEEEEEEEEGYWRGALCMLKEEHLRSRVKGILNKKREQTKYWRVGPHKIWFAAQTLIQSS